MTRASQERLSREARLRRALEREELIVETGAQLAFLKAQGCDLYQGYLYSKPVTAAEFIQLRELR